MPHTRDGPAVIVDPYSSGAVFADAFRRVGWPVVAVMSAPEPPAVYAASFQPQDFDAILVAREDEYPRVIEKLDAMNPRCILTGCESGVELTDTIAPVLLPELANRPELARARRHKGEMAAAVAAAGIPGMRQICTNRAEEVEAWISRENLLGRDLVIKPPMSASTDGVTRIEAGRGWRQRFAELLGSVDRLGHENEMLVVQEFLHGVEYAVDTVSYDGRHGVASICRYNKVDNGPFMAVYDTMDWMPPGFAGADALRDHAFAVLDAVGMRYGTSHVEVMLTENGPRLVEIGARPHGGGHPHFCRHATGDSQVDRIARSFAEGRPCDDGYELGTNLTIVFLLCREGGVVTNRAALDRIADLPSHHVSRIAIEQGDVLVPTKDLFASLDMGFVALAHEDPEQIQIDRRIIRALEADLYA